MSLASDFQMYYSETYVAFENSRGERVPFYVTEVRWQNNEPNDPWDISCIDQLKFRGYTIERNESRSNGVTFRMQERQGWKNFDELDFEVPDLGYFEVEGMERPLWLAAMPQRSTKKGFTLRKTNQGRNLERDTQNRIVWEAFNDKRSYFQKNFWFDGRNIDYKGIRVGQYDIRENVQKHLRGLSRHAEYLREMIEEGFNAERESSVQN